VLQRQAETSKIDFGALGRAVRQLRSGVVTLEQIQDPNSTSRFLESLLAAELRASEPAPDAVVVISPKVSLDQKLSERELTKRTRLQYPVFLLSYNPHPVANPCLRDEVNELPNVSAENWWEATKNRLDRTLKRMEKSLDSEADKEPTSQK
jgi:hypothetical protein